MAILEARFRYEREQWLVSLSFDGIPTAERRWIAPDLAGDKSALFRSLFAMDADQEHTGAAWQLRLRGDNGIPLAPWSELYHPVSRTHLLDCGWTVAEVVGRPQAGRFAGTVLVDGEGMEASLRQRLGPRVRPMAKGVAVMPRSLLVVAGSRKPRQALAIQQRAIDNEIDLLVWTHVVRPPRNDRLVQVHPTGETPIEGGWISQYVRHLLRGASPECAFARADLRGEMPTQDQRWLSGVCEPWEPPSHVPRIPLDWFERIDRSAQEQAVRECIDALNAETTSRRVHVLLTSGAPDAGLDLFRARTASLVPQKWAFLELSFRWAEEPARQEILLRRAVHAQSRTELRGAWEALAGKPAVPFLLILGHEVASLDGSGGLRRVTREDLQAYLTSLRAIAVTLSSSRLRVVVHLVFAGDRKTFEVLRSLREATNEFLVKVLPPLERVSVEEIESWLETNNLPTTPDELALLRDMSYDDLIQWLKVRFPEEL